MRGWPARSVRHGPDHLAVHLEHSSCLSSRPPSAGREREIALASTGFILAAVLAPSCRAGRPGRSQAGWRSPPARCSAWSPSVLAAMNGSIGVYYVLFGLAGIIGMGTTGSDFCRS